MAGDRLPRSQTTFEERRKRRGQTRTFGSNAPCGKCGVPFHEHDKIKQYDDHGPAGSYHYLYSCPPEAVGQRPESETDAESESAAEAAAESAVDD